MPDRFLLFSTKNDQAHVPRLSSFASTIADPAGERSVPSAEDLPHGSHRVGLPTVIGRPRPQLSEHSGRDQGTRPGGRVSRHEGPLVRASSNLHLAAICVHLHPSTHAFLYSPSLKLIRGSLDSISQTATVTWVQPRVLDRSQLEALARRLTEWTDKVGKVGEVSPVVIPVALSLLDPSTLTRIIIFFRSFTGCSTSETAALGLRSSRVRCP